jgi:hypothetical protein
MKVSLGCSNMLLARRLGAKPCRIEANLGPLRVWDIPETSIPVAVADGILMHWPVDEVLLAEIAEEEKKNRSSER